MTDIQEEERPSRLSYSSMTQKMYDLSKFNSDIQLDYINTYTTFYNDTTKLSGFLPNTNIIEEIYINWKKCYKMRNETDFDKYVNNEEIKNTDTFDYKKMKKIQININKIHDLSNIVPEINSEHFQYGNVDMQQIRESFKNGNFTNSFNKIEGENNPLSVSKLNIAQFIAYILYSRTKFNSDVTIDYFNKNILKQQINKDVVRQHTYINNKLINDDFPKETTPPYFYSNIFNLYLLEKIDKSFPKIDNTSKYDLMNICSISTIQHIISWYTDNFVNIILDASEINTPDEASLMIDYDIPLNDEYYDGGLNNKYYKIHIDERLQTITTIAYFRIMCMSMLNPVLKNYFGYAYYVIEFNVSTNSVILKYLCIDYDYISHNKFVSEILEIENKHSIIKNDYQNEMVQFVNDNDKNKKIDKTKAAVGTLLTMGVLSAIPLALLLGGRKKIKTKNKRRLRKRHETNKRQKTKTKTLKRKKMFTKKRKTRKVF